MFLIKSKLNEEALSIAYDVDNLDNFEHLDLGKISTLELMEIHSDSSNWVTGEPLIFNESLGVVLLSYSKESLVWFKNNLEILENHGVSKELASQFCSKCNKNLYCLDTF